MFRVVTFDLKDIKPLLDEPMNAHLSYWKDDGYKHARALAHRSLALTGLVNDTPIICAFIVELWRARGYMVVVMSQKIKEHSVVAHRGMKKILEKLPFERLEFDIPVNHKLAKKRADFLGFKIMCKHAKKFLPDGQDATIYEWVRT